MKTIAFFDLETNTKNGILDIGCIKSNGSTFHAPSVEAFLSFASDCDFLCGHNVHHHDLPQLHHHLGNGSFGQSNAIDTLYLSPLLFPARPYHRLVKDDKLQSDERNNPLNDAIKARDLFYDEVAAFQKLDEPLQKIFYGLLSGHQAFAAFFTCIGYAANQFEPETEELIRHYFGDVLCRHAPVAALVKEAPASLAYALSLIKSTDRYSITPPVGCRDRNGRC